MLGAVFGMVFVWIGLTYYDNTEKGKILSPDILIMCPKVGQATLVCNNQGIGYQLFFIEALSGCLISLFVITM